MIIGGFQKTSLIDYPKKISAIVWTIGCNFRCPFCYNKEIVMGSVKTFSEEEIVSYLKKRKNMLEGLVITGGEPLIQDDILDFCQKIKELGYLIKIDTNGMFPKKLKELIDRNLVDYIAMDVKAPLEKYEKMTGVRIDKEKIKHSIEIIKTSNIDYEFRTTFVPKLLEKKDIVDIAKLLNGAKKFFLQQFKSMEKMISDEFKKIQPHSKEYVIETLEKIKPYFNICEVRGL